MGSIRTMRDAIGPLRASAMVAIVPPIECPTTKGLVIPRRLIRATRSSVRTSQLKVRFSGSIGLWSQK